MKQHYRRCISLLFAICYLLFLSSCLGVSADIELNKNGSGTITLEYQISKALDSLGRLDGNERWNPIPVGRADFERSLDRLPEMKLLSFSSVENDRDLVINVKMEFASIRGLMAFFDASGQRSVYSGDARSGSIVFNLHDGVTAKNAELDKFIAGISKAYSVKMCMSFPNEGSLALTNPKGNAPAAIPGSEINARGKKVFFSVPLYGLISSSEGINAEFRW